MTGVLAVAVLCAGSAFIGVCFYVLLRGLWDEFWRQLAIASDEQDEDATRASERRVRSISSDLRGWR